MVMKTRDKFIEVARQLFARKGVENTTMNDIAAASDKGRRTIYTYFKSKRDIFNAVIESETDQILSRLRHIVSMPSSPEEKILDYIDCRFEAMKEIVSRNGSLRAGFFPRCEESGPRTKNHHTQRDRPASRHPAGGGRKGSV